MKKLIEIRKSKIKDCLFVFCVFLFSGCNFLDYQERTVPGIEEAFGEYSRAKGVLVAAYNELPSYFSSVGNAMLESATDDAIFVRSTNDIHNFYNGSWGPMNTIDAQWTSHYRAIRRTNLFLENANDAVLEDVKWQVETYLQRKKQWEFYRYEARFLRAFFHFELAKRYGDIPLVTKMLQQEEANSTSRTPFKDVMLWIADECDEIAPNLPVSYTDPNITPGIETGRATRGAALALRARALLYLASPLHNPEGASDYTERWTAAAEAAHDLIASGMYSNTLPAWSNVFNNWRPQTNTELIFEKRMGDSRSFEENNYSIGFEGGGTGNCPTQNLVDCYEMQSTGRGILESGSGYNPENPYTGRDPRLGMSIFFNGSQGGPTNVLREMQCFRGGLDGPPRAEASLTGYYLKKLMNPNIVMGGGGTLTNGEHCWIHFRYTEVLLNYAEAMNEVYGPNDKGPYTITARDAVNFVRRRPGVLMPVFPEGLTKDQFREKLRNERRVELAFEGHRMWDIRRWKTGEVTREIRGMEIIQEADLSFTYTPKVIQERNWNDKMYFYPIPLTEIYHTGGVIKQNPDW